MTIQLSNKNIKSEIIDKIIYNISDDLRGQAIPLATASVLIRLEIKRFKENGSIELSKKDEFIITQNLFSKKLIYEHP
jgi:hypothetical protein|tara:strand:- start:313 stop:546 length:234 start_codon:yes stop_codon:yes gene_type:complete